MQLKPPSKVVIKSTDNKGWGCFASDRILAGEIIEECHLVGLPIKPGEPSSLLIDYRFNWPKSASEWVEQVIPLGFGCIYNHNDDNNAVWQDHPEHHKVFQFIAIRDIEPGEEICTYYGPSSYWQDGRNHTNVV